MQLSFDAADRLVELIQARRGAVASEEAARVLFALERAPATLAHSLLADVVDGDARLTWLGARVGLADGAQPETLIEDAELVVFDLETTGLSASRDRMCEIGAVRVKALEIAETFETLVDPGSRCRRRSPVSPGCATPSCAARRVTELAVRRFLAFAGDAPLVAHNARFDVGFLDHAVQRLTGRRVAAPVVDTVWLARRLLHRRSERFSLAQLAHFFGTSTRSVPPRAAGRARDGGDPHRAPRPRAGARARGRSRRSSSSPRRRARRLHAKRSLVAGAPTTPGVYLFRDRNDTVLYVGKARDLRARLRSYFAGDRQRPAVEAALGALERVEWRELGSELEAALEELRLIRELRPPANARAAARPQSLPRAAGRSLGGRREPTRFGPIASKRRAQLAARALGDFEGDDLAAALPPLRAKLRRLARDLRFEDAARLRDRVAALEEVVARVAELERLRAAELCVLAPAREPGFWRAFFVARGRVVRRGRSRAARPGGSRSRPGSPRRRAAEPSLAPEDAAELLVVAGVLRKPPPELRSSRSSRRDPRRVTRA